MKRKEMRKEKKGESRLTFIISVIIAVVSLTIVTLELKLLGFSRPMSNTLFTPGWKKKTHPCTQITVTSSVHV